MSDGSKSGSRAKGATQKQKASADKVAAMVREKHDTDSGLTAAQREAVTRWEREHTNRATERVVAFDGNGKKLYESQRGSSSRTGIPSILNLTDAVITHNHPQRKVRGANDKLGWASGVGISLSDNDIAVAARFNAKEIRAKAQGYVYSLRRPEKGWPNASAMQSAYKRAERAAMVKYMGGASQRYIDEYVRKGTKNDQEAYNRLDRLNATISHIATREVAKQFGLKYTRNKA